MGGVCSTDPTMNFNRKYNFLYFMLQEDARAKQEDCPSGVSCDKGRCVPQLEICDWRNDCFDGMDEEFCTPRYDQG